MNLGQHQHLCIILAICCCGTVEVSAQVSQTYEVNIPASMSLEALRGPDSATHPLTAANVVLSNSRWRARSSSTTGSTVTFSTDHAFWNAANPAVKRDAVLRLTRLQGPPQGGWTIDVAQDQTDYGASDEVATVSMSSTAAGMQQVRMEVEFVTGDLPSLRGGDYQLTVTGTITQN